MSAHLLVAPLLAAALLAGCGGGRGASVPGRSARGALAELDGGDPARAAARLARLARGGDPFARLGVALAARRALDREGELRALLGAVEAGPGSPVALVALRRLAELSEESPAIAGEVDAGAARLLASGRLTGLAAYRARVARAAAAEAGGDHAGAIAARAENGAVSAWTLAGPFARHHALDFDGPLLHAGEIPAAVPAAGGLPPYETRVLPAPDGTVALEGEPNDADVLVLAADVTLARGGAYLLTVGTELSVRVVLGGARVAERRGFAGWLPALVQRPVTLAPGRHRLVVELSRGTARTGLHVALSREDGAPSDATFAPAPTGPGAAPAPAGPGPAPASPPPAAGPPLLEPRALAAALEPALGPALARLLAGRDALAHDPEGAKALLLEARALRPGSAPVRAALGAALAQDPTLDPGVARARGEAELREALRLDPGHAEARLALADLLGHAERRDDAERVLAELGGDAGRPPARAARARAALLRGLAERAEGLALEALPSGSCAAADLAHELAARRGDVAGEDRSAAVLGRCRGGAERLAAFHRRRGAPRAALDALDGLVRARPWAIEPALARADVLVAGGDRAGAADAVAALAAIWPRSARVWKRLGELRELAGDLPGARAARDRALLLDGADLSLRRALALADGREVLDDLAEDVPAAIRAYEGSPRRGGVSSAMVLDAAFIEIHPGGTATERTQQLIHVLDQHGVDAHGEVAIPAGAEPIAIRTRKPDGRVLEPERAGTGKGSISLTGLAPGDYVEVDYVRAVRGARGVGFAADPFYFQAAQTRLVRSVYVVRAPEGLGLEADGHGMPAPAVERAGGMERIRVERRDVAAFQPEPDAPSAGEVLPFLVVGTGGGREALQRAIGNALVEQTRPTAELRALAAEIRAAAGAGASPAALARAAHARVAQEVLGPGGGLSEDASAVLSRGRGSRLVVLKAVLSALEIPARFALVRPYSAPTAPWRFPAVALYPAVLLRVEAGPEILWLDPSSRLSPFGAFPAGLAGCEALLLPEPGEAPRVVRTPDRPAVEESRELEVRLVLGEDGRAELAGTDRYRGAAGAALESAIERLDAAARRQAVEAMLGRMFPGITVRTVEVEGEGDPERPLELRFVASIPDALRAVEGGALLEAPLFPAMLGSRFVKLARRTTPLLVPAPERSRQRIEIVAPPGLRPAAGEPARLETPFGRYVREERIVGASLVREEQLELERGRIAPEHYLEFARFAAAVDEQQERPVRLAR